MNPLVVEQSITSASPAVFALSTPDESVEELTFEKVEKVISPMVIPISSLANLLSSRESCFWINRWRCLSHHESRKRVVKW